MFGVITTYLLLIITAINTYFLYFNEGFEPYKEQSIYAFVTLGLLGLILINMLIYNIVSKRSVKKGFLRFSLLIAFSLFVVSAFTRITENYEGMITLWRFSQTFLYGLIFISLLATSYGFYKKLKEIAQKRNNYL